ncbi:MAG: hypothetical protein WC603_02755 [Candidatus Paceibacterota bacterium]|jgi:hypothetical protein
MKNQENTNPSIFSLSGRIDILMLDTTESLEKDLRNHPELLSILRNNDVSTLYWPDCSGFTAELSQPSDFQEFMSIGNMKIMKGPQTDGLAIEKNSAVMFETTECSPIVIYHDKRNDLLITAKAGFNSVIDKLQIFHGQKFREHWSVIDNIAKLADAHESYDYEIFIVGGLEPDSFRYDIEEPGSETANKMVLSFLQNNYAENAVPLGEKHGGVSVPSIIGEQFILHGFKSKRISYQKMQTSPSLCWWDHCYDATGGKTCARKVILIIYK